MHECVHQFFIIYQALTIIDDSYNGGPQAMWAALQALGRLVPEQQGRRIAVLGDMAELGQFAIQEHQALVPFVQQNRVDLTFLYGPYMRYLQEQLPPSIICQMSISSL